MGIFRTGSPYGHIGPTVVGPWVLHVQWGVFDVLGMRVPDEEGAGDPHHEDPAFPHLYRSLGSCGIPYRQWVSDMGLSCCGFGVTICRRGNHWGGRVECRTAFNWFLFRKFLNQACGTRRVS